MDLAYRWFTRLDFEQEVPDHSTFSKNRHGRFRASGVFREVFEEIVRRCLQAGLVEGKDLAVDGTMIEANANPQSRVPREKLNEVGVSRTAREYVSELEKGQSGFRYEDGLNYRSGCCLGQEGWTGEDGLFRQLLDRYQESSHPRGRSHTCTLPSRDRGPRERWWNRSRSWDLYRKL
jgi:hypothetical protein